MQFTNRKIVTLDLKDNIYTIAIAIKKTFIEDWDYHFIMFQRYEGEKRILPHRLNETANEDYFIFTLEIPFEEHQSFLTEVETIDLSIVRKRDEEENQYRIKSNYDYVEFLKLKTGNGFIFYPATTKNGNLSFFYREDFLYAKVERADLSKAGMLSLKGMYLQSYLDMNQVKKITLVAATNLHDDMIRIPVERIDIPENYATYSWYTERKNNGFQVELDLAQHLSLGKMQYFKFYLQIEAEIAGEIVTIESSRMKLNHLVVKYPINQKLRVGSKKFKISLKPTKKSKYLSLSTKEFKLPAELLSNAKRKWVEIRRSQQLLKLYKSAFYILGKILPANKKLVMFESFHGKQYSDNPRAIYEYMSEHHKNYELIWSADRRHLPHFEGRNIKFVRRFSVRWLFLMARSKYWITNARLPLWIPKPKHTTYLQTWHGTPLKRLATDMEEVHMPGTNAEKYKRNFTKEASKWDYLISPNNYSSKIFERAFAFDKEMIESGYPRNDYLYTSNNAKEISRIKKELELPNDKKVILYAPTWRDNQFYGKGRYKFDLAMDLDKLQAAFGETHVIVLRMHYLVAENLDIEAYKGFVYDFSYHEDIRNLYLISDILITDYSSVFFDYANLRRPMLFFVYDIEDYRDNLRGFYFDFEEKAPGPLVKTTEELIDEINTIEANEFIPSDSYEAFYNRFCYLEDGEASKRVVERVFNSKK